MRNGYILLHRKGITPDEWKHPRRALAWIDLLTLTNYEDSVVTVSYGFLAKRWRVSKDTAYQWIRHWITERQLERLPERSAERNAERFFVVNYAEYQRSTERVTERSAERPTERKGEQRYQVISNNSEESNHNNVSSEILNWLSKHPIKDAVAYLAKMESEAGQDAVRRAWRKAKQLSTVRKPSDLFSLALELSISPLVSAGEE